MLIIFLLNIDNISVQILLSYTQKFISRFFYHLMIMKKYIFALIYLTIVVLNRSSTFANNLGGVSLSFCNTTGNLLNYTIEPGRISDICYTLTNNSKENLIIKINFVDGTYTNDKRQNRACLGENETKNFGICPINKVYFDNKIFF